MSATNIKATIGKDHYRVEIVAGKHTIIADEPIESDGGDKGMNPFEILASALGACTCATVRMYADRKEIKLDGLDVTVTLIKDTEKNETNLTRSIALYGDLTDKEKEQLLQIANKCPIHKALTNPIHIKTRLE